MTATATMLSALACGWHDPGDPQPAKEMRNALSPGMTLEEVCRTVSPLAPVAGPCLVGRGCKGNWDILALEAEQSGHVLTQYPRDAATEKRVEKLNDAALARTFQDMRSCSVLKVGWGYYDVHLRLDDRGRLREISRVLVEGNPETPLE